MRTIGAVALGAMSMLTMAAAWTVGAQTPRPAPAPAQTQGQVPERTRPMIQTSGTAEVRVTPDRAAIVLGVMTRGPTVTQATAENARLQRAVIAALRQQGIPAERIGTAGFNVHPEHRHDPRGERAPTVTGYVVNNTVRVEVHDIERVGALIDAALAAGANNMHGLHFWSSNVDEARQRALGEAVARARADAEAMARAAGGQLGALEALQYGVIPDVRPMAPMVRMEAAMADTPISPGEQTLSVTVTGRWLFWE